MERAFCRSPCAPPHSRRRACAASAEPPAEPRKPLQPLPRTLGDPTLKRVLPGYAPSPLPSTFGAAYGDERKCAL